MVEAAIVLFVEGTVKGDVVVPCYHNLYRVGQSGQIVIKLLHLFHQPSCCEVASVDEHIPIWHLQLLCTLLHRVMRVGDADEAQVPWFSGRTAVPLSVYDKALNLCHRLPK
mgnify:CR=1 FL=1